MKKFLSVLLALAMIFSLTVTVSADETKGEMDGYVVVLHTNDVHGAISGYAKVAALKKAYEAEGAYVLLMDAGDFCQGDPTVSVSQGKTAVAGKPAITSSDIPFLMRTWQGMTSRPLATTSSTTAMTIW